MALSALADFCERAFVTSEGHSGARFRRALAAGNLTAAEQAAFELPFIPLADARALVELYAVKGAAPEMTMIVLPISAGRPTAAGSPPPVPRGLRWSPGSTGSATSQRLQSVPQPFVGHKECKRLFFYRVPEHFRVGWIVHGPRGLPRFAPVPAPAIVEAQADRRC